MTEQIMLTVSPAALFLLLYIFVLYLFVSFIVHFFYCASFIVYGCNDGDYCFSRVGYYCIRSKPMFAWKRITQHGKVGHLLGGTTSMSSPLSKYRGDMSPHTPQSPPLYGCVCLKQTGMMTMMMMMMAMTA